MNSVLYILTTISAVLFAIAMTLPYLNNFLFPSVIIPPLVYDVLSFGGLGGLIVFGLAYRLTKPKETAEVQE